MLSSMTYRYPPHIYSESFSAGSRGSYVGEVETIFAVTPVEEGWHWASLIALALCAEGFVFLTLAGHALAGRALLSAFVAGVIWRSVSHAPASEATGLGKLRAALLAAAVAILLLLGPAVLTRLFSPLHVRSAGFTPHLTGVSLPARTGMDDSSYQGVLLWPKVPRKAVVVAPLPRARAVSIARIDKPLVIPFQGYYAYFKAPAKQPGRKAHRAHGLPTSVDIRSTDWHPLMMEAHQALAAPVDLACCREIEVAIVNADNRPGKIELAVVLSDEQHSRSLYLGSHLVESSESPGFSLNRPPVEEALRFALPAKSTMQRFDEITVVFMPSAERALAGVKIAILEFRLLPRESY